MVHGLKRKNGALVLNGEYNYLRIKKVDGGYKVSHRDFNGNWDHRGDMVYKKLHNAVKAGKATFGINETVAKEMFKKQPRRVDTKEEREARGRRYIDYCMGYDINNFFDKREREESKPKELAPSGKMAQILKMAMAYADEKAKNNYGL